MKEAGLAGLLMLAALGCGLSKGNNYASSRARGVPALPEAPTVNFDLGLLSGRWTTECTMDPLWAQVNISPSDKPHLRNRIRLTPSGRFLIESTTYAHEGCVQGDELQSMTVNGTYVNYPRKGLEMTGLEMLVVFHTAEAAEAASRADGVGLCGINEWSEDEIRDVTATPCLGDGRHTLVILDLNSKELRVRRYYLVQSENKWLWRDELLNRE